MPKHDHSVQEALHVSSWILIFAGLYRCELCGYRSGNSDRGPRFRFLDDPKLRELYESKKREGWMRQLGYGDLESRARG